MKVISKAILDPSKFKARTGFGHTQGRINLLML
jgi:hypothetical protein